MVITGAGSGLGLALAKRFAARGDSVWGLTRTTQHWKSARRMVAKPDRFHLAQVDVTSEAAVRRFFKSARNAMGPIDLVVNNAGYSGRPRELSRLALAEFDRHLKQNLVSVFLVSKYALPILRKQKRGLIINISSFAGKRAVPLLAAYSASKFGVLALSQAIAKENRDTGPGCITVCPGGIQTGMRAKLFGRAEARKQQPPDFVADVIMDVVNGKIPVESGGDIVVRHGKVTAINPAPPA